MRTKLVYNKLQSFIAMFIAWFAGYIYFAIYMVHFSNWGYVTDFTFILSWTGIFTLISAFVFVPIIIKGYNKTFLTRQTKLFPLVTGAASQLVLALLLLPFTDLRPFEISWFYFGYAGIIGCVFGVFYAMFQIFWPFDSTSTWLRKSLIIISPALFLVFLFQLFPYITPTLAYKYFGDSIKEKAIFYVMGKYKVGDKISDLESQLPGLTGQGLGQPADIGMASGSGYGFSYDIKFEKGIITELVIDSSK
ncbi:hypothetical protein Q5H92_16980 [Hymenobacter sp. M29]|uniref:Uncharacterized protein n=1 Tax=Hymenobacter mellowenesis TaxID=3063995 RepID=A0ABT9AHA3_9BACT|nr:hypothetical protein [Hymenobacter sp. M29]MDO7848062.1 hypothetical protein [Hymenobacter sp. M29]